MPNTNIYFHQENIHKYYGHDTYCTGDTWGPGGEVNKPGAIPGLRHCESWVLWHIWETIARPLTLCIIKSCAITRVILRVHLEASSSIAL